MSARNGDPLQAPAASVCICGHADCGRVGETAAVGPDRHSAQYQPAANHARRDHRRKREKHAVHRRGADTRRPDPGRLCRADRANQRRGEIQSEGWRAAAGISVAELDEYRRLGDTELRHATGKGDRRTNRGFAGAGRKSGDTFIAVCPAGAERPVEFRASVRSLQRIWSQARR